LFENAILDIKKYTKKSETLYKMSVSIDKEISQLYAKMEIAKLTAKEALG
jgi:hypothetical protein